MRAQGWKHEFELRQVLHLSELRAPYDGVDLVIIPGLWAQHVVDKESKQCSWYRLLVASTDNDTRVFIFKYDVEDVQDGRVWHRLLDLSRLLLDSLRQVRPFDVQRRPLFFICHGLGGLLLKQALNLAQQRYPMVSNALSGIIFLGSPHLTTADDERWENWQLLLKLYRKDVPKSALRMEDIETLASVCGGFNALNLRIPVLSVYEEKKTNIRDAGPLGRFKTTERLLVDQSHATVKTSYEEVFGVDSSHVDLNFIKHGTPLFNRLVAYLNKAPAVGLSVVAEAYRRMHINIDLSDTNSHSSRLQSNERGDSLVRDADLPTIQVDPDAVNSSKRASLHKQVLLPCYSLLSSRNRNFYGQEEIIKLIDEKFMTSVPPEQNTTPQSGQAEEDFEPVSSFALCGLGGLGKTEIAVEYMHTRKSKFDAVFWINSSNAEKMDEGFQDIALKLALMIQEEALSSDPKVVREVVKAWLTNPVRTLDSEPQGHTSDVRWLLIFDNADEPDHLYDFWPSSGPGCILVTSRNPFIRQPSVAGLSGIDLPTMQKDDAGRFLQKISRRETEAESLQKCSSIAEMLGGLPLAIMQMGNIIRTKVLSLSEFVEYYEHDTRRFQESPVAGLSAEQTIASIWSIESLPPGAIALLRVLSVLDADSIPEEILLTGAKETDLEDYPQDKFQYFDAREALVKSSLITHNMDLKFLRIHRLVQDVVRQKLTIDQLRVIYDAAVVLVSAVWPFLDDSDPGDLNEVGRWRKVQGYLPHVIAFKSHLEGQRPEILKPNIRICRLLNEVAWFYQIRYRTLTMAESPVYAKWSQRVLETQSEWRDRNQYTKLLADAYRYHGIAAIFLNSDDAVPYCKKWLGMLVERIQEYQEPGDIATMPVAYNETATAYMRIPDQKEALQLWEMACEILERTTGPDQLPFPFPWMHRAIVLTYSGEADSAYSILNPVLERREAKLGVDDTKGLETGIILSHMGTVRKAQGHADDSYRFFQRGAAVLTVAAGEKNTLTCQAYYRLASAHYDRQKYKDTEELLEKCHAVFKDPPWSKPEFARVCWKLGHTLLAENAQDKIERAKSLLDQAMSLRRELVPDDGRKEPELRDDDWNQLVFYVDR